MFSPYFTTLNTFILIFLTLSYTFLCDCHSVDIGINNTHSGVTFAAGYDKAFPPTPSPVEVSLYVYVQTVSPIQSSEMEFRVNMRWTMFWVDTRISVQLDDDYDDIDDNDNDVCLQKAAYVIAPKGFESKIWMPDPFIVNAKYSGIKQFDKKLTNLVIYPNHTLAFTMILNATIACDMDFEFYPMDVQNCPMVVQSFAYDASLVRFVWDDFVVTPRRLIQFMVVQPKTLPFQRLEYVPQEGHFTQLVATFRFERLISSHIVQSFIPTSLVVTLSWFSFWLGLDVTPARGYLLMACTLSLEIHLGGLKTEFPPVAYVKAVDIWIFGCIFWVFCALAEFIVVKVVFQVTEEERKANQVYSLKKARLDQKLLEEYEIDAFDAANYVCAEVTRAEGQIMDQMHTPYTEFWLWQELQLPPTCPRQVFLDSGLPLTPMAYRKRRLGSTVLSGRSVATSNLPLVQKSLCFGIALPLVWSGDNDDNGRSRIVLWREIDNWAKLMFPLCFILFVIVYWVVLGLHSIFA